jgi:hypothetical protein
MIRKRIVQNVSVVLNVTKHVLIEPCFMNAMIKTAPLIILQIVPIALFKKPQFDMQTIKPNLVVSKFSAYVTLHVIANSRLANADLDYVRCEISNPMRLSWNIAVK